MSKTIWALLFLLAVASASAPKIQQQSEEEGTRVVFYIENEIQQPEDYVEISIEIKSQQPSLQHAIDEAKHIVQQVESIITKYCQAYAKNKKDCEGVVETSEYEIDPIYQLVRKVPTFVVVHQTVAKIKDVRNIGKLTDDILKAGVSKINSFEWKPLEQVDNEEKAVSEGIELINSICNKIGSNLGRIVAVSEVTDYEEEEEEEEPAAEQGEEGEEAEQQEEQEEQPTVVYRFEIICQDKAGKGKK